MFIFIKTTDDQSALSAFLGIDGIYYWKSFNYPLIQIENIKRPEDFKINKISFIDMGITGENTEYHGR